jgi:hypothetical protein
VTEELYGDRRDRLLRRANDAIWTHHTWITVLRRAIAEGASEYTVDVVGDEERCEIGRWLAAEIPNDFRGTELYDATRRAHARFHREASSLLEMALAGKKHQASASMDPGGAFFLVAANMRAVLYEWAKALQPE